MDPHINPHIADHLVPAAYNIASRTAKAQVEPVLLHHLPLQAAECRASSSAGHRHRQGDTLRRLKGVARPRITKSTARREGHPYHGSAAAERKSPSSSAAASGQTAVRLSKAELRRETSLQKWITAATEEDKLARKVGRDFSDQHEHAAPPVQPRRPPTAKVFTVGAMKKRKV